MLFRQATSEDVPQLVAWNAELIQDEGSRNAMTGAELEARMRHWLDGRYSAAIFSQDDVPVAYMLWREQAAFVYVRHFFVARAWRRKGMGRAAWQEFMRQVPPHKKVRLDVLVDNARGRAFWRAVGFREYALKLELDQTFGLE